MNKERKSWEKLNDRMLQKTRVFDLWVKKMRSPTGDYEDDFFYIRTLDWVNVIPVTPDRQVVFVEQYRHGIDERVLETPGGLLDDPQGDPLAAACRELAEETGYAAPRLDYLGSVRPNPAMLNNRCHVFLALDAVPSTAQELEPAEDITLHLFPLAEIPKLVTSGRIHHATIICGFFLLQTLRPELFSQR